MLNIKIDIIPLPDTHHKSCNYCNREFKTCRVLKLLIIKRVQIESCFRICNICLKRLHNKIHTRTTIVLS